MITFYTTYDLNEYKLRANMYCDNQPFGSVAWSTKYFSTLPSKGLNG